MTAARGTGEAPILLDLSRLLSRAEAWTPTGIDRVECAYARHFAASAPERLKFLAMNRWGLFGEVSAAHATAFVDRLVELWRDGDSAQAAHVARDARRLRREILLGAGSSLFAREKKEEARPVYLLVSHHHLDRPDVIARLKMRAHFVCLVHDLIPISYPEYARPGQAERHARRMETVGLHADAAILNSNATREALEAFLHGRGRQPRLVVAPLGIDRPPPSRANTIAPLDAPYFVCIGTIEPKKNHLLLLNLWREMANACPSETPHLFLVGRRGWENENVVDMIERSIPLKGLVHELGVVCDTEASRLLAGARALLMPTFAEGYGLPLAEALAGGVPAICSALPVLREVGGGAPEYLDPLDGPSWKAAILDYAGASSLRRANQIERLAAWRAPSWKDHFAIVEALITDTTS